VTPEQFIRSLELQPARPVYLFLGPEMHRRRQCREALLRKALTAEERESGMTRHDLDARPLSDVLDDARSMSLFAGNRVIWVGAAEAALPRGKSAAADPGMDDGAGSSVKGDAVLLAAYCSDPTPGVVLVFDCSRYEFEGEDKARCERVAKFYAAAPEIVEFHRTTASEARVFAQKRASELGLKIAAPQLDRLVEATAADLARLVNELDKLALYSQPQGGEITEQDIAALVPNLSETTIFALVNALARRDRLESLRILDTLIREGEYLPLALTFLGGLLRMALAAREQQLRSVQDVQSYFQRQGIAMWRARAEQVYNTSLKFPKEKLETAISLVFRADRDLKGSRPDDRIVMEDFVLRLT
jgi:DNA polymerase-3 subunit delta